MNTKNEQLKTGVISRRDFIKNGAFLGGSLAFAGCLFAQENGQNGNNSFYPLNDAENVIYSVCLQCHTACPIKGKIQDGVLAKIDGPAYSTMSMQPQIPYTTDIETAARIDGKLCPKGQAGIQSLYDPYRVVKVLKRAGKRGENKWKVISFDKAIEEIVNGGKLFSNVPGEENRNVEGLKDIYKVRDPKLMKALKTDAAKVVKKEMNLDEFKKKHKNNLGDLINPNHPDLGPVNNQFCFLAGRIEHGRKELGKRWLKDAFGSVNFYEHTTICEQSHHIAFAQATNKYSYGKWGGGKHHLKPDALHSEFIIYFGTSPFEANFGPTVMTERVTDGLVNNRLKIAVVDPRFSKTASKAWKWVPIQPGSDAAFVLGMIRWILDHDRQNTAYLSNSNKAAAENNGETTWTTATYLVKLDENDQPGKYLRASDIGMGDEHTFVVLKNGKPVTTAIDGTKKSVVGDLLVNQTIKGIKVKSAFQLLWEESHKNSLTQWATLAGVKVKDIQKLANEFTLHGKKAVAEFYRGPVQHTNGYYNGQALIALNMLIGSAGWKGGWGPGGSHWHESGGKTNNPFNFKKLHPGKLGSFGITVSKEKSHYEKTTLYQKDGYPAKRPFYPFTGNVYQEVIPAAGDRYPYGLKALYLHKGTPVFASPAGHKMIEILTDVKKIPLFFASDIVVGESSMYADYIIPDQSIWERWGFPHTTPDVQNKTSKIRQPIVAPMTETVSVMGEKIAVSMEATLLAIADKLGLSGFGKNGFGDGIGFTRPEDFWLKLAANIAMGDKKNEEVPEASKKEIDIFWKARRHLPKELFNPKRFEKAAGPYWKRVVYVLNRGGRYEDFSKAYDGDHLNHRYKGYFNLYAEPVGTSRNSLSGDYFSGVATFEHTKDAAGKNVDLSGFRYHLITYKEITGGQSRTLPIDYWLSSVLPENFILMNASDARKDGLKEGDLVTLSSPSNQDGVWDLKNGTHIPMRGKIKITEGIRPGTIAVSWHFGHWAYGAADLIVNGHNIKGDEKRRTGLCPNAAMLVDPVLKNVCLSDPIGGSASFYDTRVNLIKTS